MRPILDDDQELFSSVLRDYAMSELAPHYARWQNEPYPRERIRSLAQLGVLGLRIPEEYGGSPGAFVMAGIASEELSRGDFNVHNLIGLAAIAAEILKKSADEDLKTRWLPAIASGECVTAFGLTEPTVGSDAANLSCTARRVGDTYVINGEKASITFAGFADVCIVFARTGGDGSRGVSAFWVPLQDRVTRSVYDSAGGALTARGSLFFDDVVVPADHLLGGEGLGFSQAMGAFDFNRAIIALAACGTAQQSLDETVIYARQRQTFGKPLARHEGVAFQVAEHLARMHAARLVAFETLALADEGRPHTIQAAMCKWMGPAWAVQAIHTCLLLHGWAGYGRDLPFDQRMRDVMGLEVGDGTAEIMKAVIARETFGNAFASHR